MGISITHDPPRKASAVAHNGLLLIEQLIISRIFYSILNDLTAAPSWFGCAMISRLRSVIWISPYYAPQGNSRAARRNSCAAGTIHAVRQFTRRKAQFIVETIVRMKRYIASSVRNLYRSFYPFFLAVVIDAIKSFLSLLHCENILAYSSSESILSHEKYQANSQFHSILLVRSEIC